jgi:hypothetical protein
MYVSTIQFYINELLYNTKQRIYKIVFVDNSGWNLDQIKKKLSNGDNSSLEFISLDPMLFDINKGKGYNELLLINLAIEQSLFIQESKAFLKVTGRYPIYNIKYFMDYASKLLLSKRKDLYIDIKDHRLYDWLRLGWCGHAADVRLFASTVSFYQKNIANRYKELNDYSGHLSEGLLYNIVKPLIGKQNIVCRFRKEVHFGGLEGSNVKAVSFSKEQDSFKGKLKRYIGNFIRKFLPFFWF